MPIKVKALGLIEGAKDFNFAFRSLVQTFAHKVAADLNSVTDNSGGTGSSTVTAIADFVNVAASGSSLAGKATTETAYNTVLDAVRELYAKANEVNTALGLDTVTYSGGGTSTDGTIAAVTVSVTGAATGVLATSMNTVKNALDAAFYNLVVIVNKAAEATGETPVTIGYSKTLATTISAITIDGGTAADPGITKVAVDASLVVYRNNVAAVAAVLNALTVPAAPLIVAS